MLILKLSAGDTDQSCDLIAQTNPNSILINLNRTNVKGWPYSNNFDEWPTAASSKLSGSV